VAVTAEFKEAVLKKNLLRVRIMLKDSLLVDKSFKQFDEMIKYAESKLGSTIWIDDQEDDDIFSQSPEELNNILAGLVNHFSKRRVRCLKEMIRRKYPSKKISQEFKSTDKQQFIKKTALTLQTYSNINKEKQKITNIIGKTLKKKENFHKREDIEDIRKAAQNIVNYCDEILGK